MISVGLPVYNGEHYVRQALDSLLAQESVEFEVIISDNASTDKTESICREYAAKDKRITYHRIETNQGPIWNFNHVFDQASGEYFMLACHDDYWHPLYLRSCLDVLQKMQGVVLAGCIADSIDNRTSEKVSADIGLSTVGLTPSERFKTYKRYHINGGLNAIFHGLYRREMLAKVMPIKNMIGPDFTLLLELSLHGEFFTVQKHYMSKRLGGDSTNMKTASSALSMRKTSFRLRYPNLTRETGLLDVIRRSGQLTSLEKINLSFWSVGNFLKNSFINRAGLRPAPVM